MIMMMMSRTIRLSAIMMRALSRVAVFEFGPRLSAGRPAGAGAGSWRAVQEVVRVEQDDDLRLAARSGWRANAAREAAREAEDVHTVWRSSCRTVSRWRWRWRWRWRGRPPSLLLARAQTQPARRAHKDSPLGRDGTTCRFTLQQIGLDCWPPMLASVASRRPAARRKTGAPLLCCDSLGLGLGLAR